MNNNNEFLDSFSEIWNCIIAIQAEIKLVAYGKRKPEGALIIIGKKSQKAIYYLGEIRKKIIKKNNGKIGDGGNENR